VLTGASTAPDLAEVGSISVTSTFSLAPDENETEGSPPGRAVSRRNLVFGWIRIGPGP